MSVDAPPPQIDPQTHALFLDIDGTLLEFSDHPEKVIVTEALIEILTTLSDTFSGALALASGRAIADIDGLFDPYMGPAAGLHGVEIRMSDGDIQSAADDDALAKTRDALDQQFGNTAGIMIEDKGACVAIHYRNAPEQKPLVQDVVERTHATLGDDYKLLAGNMVFEIKPSSVDKGKAIGTLMADAPFKGRRPIFLGDDVTDEDGFAVVNELDGIAVCVGGRKPTVAPYRLSDVAAVHTWLQTLNEQHSTKKGSRT